MIVPMKKATIIVLDRDAEAATQDLRRLGVLHVEHHRPPQGQDINVLQDDLGLLNNCLDIFAKLGSRLNLGIATGANIPDWRQHSRHIIDLWHRYEQLDTYAKSLQVQIEQWRDWGDFNPQEIQRLSGKGIYIKLCALPLKQFKEFSSTAIVRNIFTRFGIAHCIVISREKLELGFNEIALPHYSLSHLQERLFEAQNTASSLKGQLLQYVSFHAECLKVRKQIEKEIEFRQALRGMGKEEKISYISGYLPFDTAARLEQKARENSWGIVVSDPEEEDSVPTLIRTPAWISIIRPVFKLLEIIPGYRELDISPLFLIFFSLFFGMIIGDAGYGLVYILLTFLAQKKWGQKIDIRVFFLFYALSFCAIIWGLLTGTVFGQEWYLNAGLKPLIPLLNDTKFLQAFCFFLGAVHLSLAHAWRAALKFPSPSALSDAGWICLLWAGFFLAKTLILDDVFVFFGKWLIIIGIPLVIFFTSPSRNIFKAVGTGLAAIALSLVNSFTDVVSYIRLFAVGLAGLAIADTVNTLAAEISSNVWFIKPLILFVGHTINITLGPMSVLVHGVRLNVLEFCGHANVSWGGTAYRPLKEHKEALYG